ncbi:DUF3857 domain-containing protein [Hymenobacter rubidus]|uniref:DUF3857 domain-containing protein n=1 Tax=Hymenobacter rubidus TaxID=1441626 RepID=UPI00191E45A7|nr:DUF3857 domain-containing protein [Hymenobacter rubidus]
MQAAILLNGWRRTLPLLTGLFGAALGAQAQPEPIKFGQVDRNDLTAAPFAGDSAAPAVVLCDYGRSRLKGNQGGFQVVFERVTRIKILSKAGYDQATVEIPLYHRNDDQEKVVGLRGFTYNLVNGQVEKTKLEATSAFIEKRTPNINVQKFTLPNVREGAVIEYAYTLTSDFLFNFQDWTFEREIPVRWSEYRVSIPVFYQYKILYQGYREFDVSTSKVGSESLLVENKIPSGGGLASGQSAGMLTIASPTEEHQWVLKNLPAFREEPYMTTAQDYLARLDFELTGEQWPNSPYHDLSGSWEKMNASLLGEEAFGGRIGRNSPLHEQAQALAAQYPDLTARAAAVRQLVMAAVRYNGTNRYSTEEPLRKAVDTHRGTSADVNLLLIAALRDAGLTAHPVLLSTRDHGHISKEYPLLERFNYVVAAVPLADGKDLLVDATEPLLPCGVLPERCLNKVGRLITKKPEDGRWVDLVPAQRHVHYQQATLTLDAQGGLTGKVHDEHGGYAAADARAALAAQGEKKYLAALAQRHEGWAFTKAAVAQVEAVEKPLALEYEFSLPADDKAATGPFYLSPLRLFAGEQNPFRHEARTFAVDLGVPLEETLVVDLALPTGYELAELPKPAVVNLPDNGGRFIYSVSAVGPGNVQLTSRLNLRNTVYAANQYPNLRELYRLLLARQNEKLIIQKKAGG